MPGPVPLLAILTSVVSLQVEESEITRYYQRCQSTFLTAATLGQLYAGGWRAAAKADFGTIFFFGRRRLLFCLLDLNLSLKAGPFFALLFLFPIFLLILHLHVIPLDKLANFLVVLNLSLLFWFGPCRLFLSYVFQDF